MKSISRLLLSGVFLVLNGSASAAEEAQLKLQKVVDDVYAIVGSLGNRSPENLGNNATFGFVVTPQGVVLIDPGGTYKGASRIHELIKTVTDMPVKYVINTGGQDHRWLGNDYFGRQGASIIASRAAVEYQKESLNDILLRLSNTAGDAAVEGTRESYANIQFDESYEFTFGDVRFHITTGGVAHSPGDSWVWLPYERVVFSGDIIYVERMLAVSSTSNSEAWLAAFEAMEALDPQYVVPGHGAPTTIDAARAATYDYLTSLRTAVAEFIEAGGEIYDLHKIDQSRFSHLLNFEQLQGRNAQQVFQEMEW
ncbi:MAG: MBL fold metallo-hydrolase [Gammaproteobacteria bacterium]|nr:MBL fold metallo-hydrolase [Gammaproteobacteria bacterium]